MARALHYRENVLNILFELFINGVHRAVPSVFKQLEAVQLYLTSMSLDSNRITKAQNNARKKDQVHRESENDQPSECTVLLKHAALKSQEKRNHCVNRATTCAQAHGPAHA